MYFVEAAHTRRVAALFPRAVVRTVPGAGHWVHVAKPRELHQEVAAFLAANALA